MSLHAKTVAAVLAAVSASTLVAQTALPEARVAHGAGLASKKGPPDDATDDLPLLATLDQVHTGEYAALDAVSPSEERFDELLSDRSTGERASLDPRLLGLLRELAEKHPGCRIERHVFARVHLVQGCQERPVVVSVLGRTLLAREPGPVCHARLG